MELIYEGRIAGVTFSPARENVARATAVYKTRAPLVKLEHEPSNPHDPEAIRVIFQGEGPDLFMGHIPKPFNSKLLAVGLDNVTAKFDRWTELSGKTAGAFIEVSKAAPGVTTAGTLKGRDQYNRALMNLYRPYLTKFPEIRFAELLHGRYNVGETRLLTLEQMDDLVRFMEKGLQE